MNRESSTPEEGTTRAWKEETRAAAAVAFHDRTVLQGKCLGSATNSLPGTGKYAFTSATDFYVARKFFNSSN